MMILIFLVGQYCDNLANSMFNVINGNRSSNGLDHLKSIQNLENAARDQALYMCENSNLTHDNPQGDLQQRVKRNGFKGYSIGENIAKSHSDNYNEVAKIWMNSSRHKRNILGDFNYTGIATCLDKKGTRYWVQVFGKDTKSQDSNDPDSNVILEDKNDLLPGNFEENYNQFYNRLKNRRKMMPDISYRMPEMMSGYCFRLEDCMPNQTLFSSVYRPDSFQMPSKITVTKYKTSFVSVSTPVFMTELNQPQMSIFQPQASISTKYVYLTSTTPIQSSVPIITVTKTTSITVERRDQHDNNESKISEKNKETITVTKSMGNTLTVTKSIENTLTVTQSVTQSVEKIVTVTKDIENVITVTKDVENTITVTKTMKIPNTSTFQVEKTINISMKAPQTYFPRSNSSSVIPSRMKPKFIQLVPEKEVSLDNLIQTNDNSRFNFNNDFNKDANDAGLRRLFSDDDNERRFNLRDILSGEKSGFLNVPCGTRDNPCIKTLLIRG